MKKNIRISIFNIIIIGMLVFLANSCEDNLSVPANDVKDIDGNKYTSVKIGTQVWMVENLKVTHYRNGDAISTSGVAEDAFYNDYNNDANNSITYGRLYSWGAVTDNRNIAPEGWHVPSDTEWITLTDYLGGENVAGGKLKEAGTIHWLSPNTGATNESGFTALPGGDRSDWNRESPGSFEDLGHLGRWWSSTGTDSQSGVNVWSRTMVYSSGEVLRYNNHPTWEVILHSVRCIKD